LQFTSVKYNKKLLVF